MNGFCENCKLSIGDDIRKILDERGIPYFEKPTGSGVRFWINWDENHADYSKSVGVDFDGSCYAIFDYLTPEQAIDTVLGKSD